MFENMAEADTFRDWIHALQVACNIEKSIDHTYDDILQTLYGKTTKSISIDGKYVIMNQPYNNLLHMNILATSLKKYIEKLDNTYSTDK
jgi:hypothetical protein